MFTPPKNPLDHEIKARLDSANPLSDWFIQIFRNSF